MATELVGLVAIERGAILIVSTGRILLVLTFSDHGKSVADLLIFLERLGDVVQARECRVMLRQ
jgi:hypothetical protein